MPLPDVPLPLLIPIGAILAACITGAVSFVSLVISKEQKISEFRQAWIDAFRLELSDFAGQARRISVEQTPLNVKAMLSYTTIEILEADENGQRRLDPFHDNRQRMAQAYYALRLRLNPLEKDHQALLNSLDNVYRIINQRSEAIRYSETVQELDAMFQVAQGVLKREWIRVKDGERGFLMVVAIAKWTAIIFAFTFIIVIGLAIWNSVH